MKFDVRKLVVGPIEANCYLVWQEPVDSGPQKSATADSQSPTANRRPCLVIDPGGDPERILAALQEENLRPEAIVATHCHGDHLGAVNELLDAFPNATWAVGEPEREWPGKPTLNLSYGFGISLRVRPPTRLLRDGDELVVGRTSSAETDNRQPTTEGLLFKALAVPGHSPGSIAYYCEAGKVVFTGDALFAGNIGRADLPGGDEEQLVAAIRAKILTLPEDTVVWPGRANRSRVGAEKRGNPYVGLGRK